MYINIFLFYMYVYDVYLFLNDMYCEHPLNITIIPLPFIMNIFFFA